MHVGKLSLVSAGWIATQIGATIAEVESKLAEAGHEPFLTNGGVPYYHGDIFWDDFEEFSPAAEKYFFGADKPRPQKIFRESAA